MEGKMTEGKSKKELKKKKNRKSKDLKGDKKGICLLSFFRSPAFFSLASQESESDLGLVLHLREVMRSREKKTK